MEEDLEGFVQTMVVSTSQEALLISMVEQELRGSSQSLTTRNRMEWQKGRTERSLCPPGWQRMGDGSSLSLSIQ